MTNEPIRVILITGYSRSGSTLLARMLGEVDGVVSPGELRYLWRRGLVENRRCDCGEPSLSCPFWGKALERAFGSVAELDHEAVLRLQSRVDRVKRIPSLASGSPREGLGEEVATYLSYFERLYEAIADVSGSRIVVDSSKDPSFGHVLARSERIELHAVHLVRDSRAVAHSWSRHKDDPGTGRAMARQSPIRSALEWNVSNLAAGWLTRRVTSSLFLRYEDMVRAPGTAVRQVLTLVGGEGNVALEGSSVRLAAGHAVSGNPMRFERGLIPIRVDDSWREEMPPWRRAQVTALTWPGLVALGYLPWRRK